MLDPTLVQTEMVHLQRHFRVSITCHDVVFEEFA